MLFQPPGGTGFILSNACFQSDRKQGLLKFHVPVSEFPIATEQAHCKINSHLPWFFKVSINVCVMFVSEDSGSRSLAKMLSNAYQ